MIEAVENISVPLASHFQWNNVSRAGPIRRIFQSWPTVPFVCYLPRNFLANNFAVPPRSVLDVRIVAVGTECNGIKLGVMRINRAGNQLPDTALLPVRFSRKTSRNRFPVSTVFVDGFAFNRIKFVSHHTLKEHSVKYDVSRFVRR